MPPILYLIDGHALAYRAYFALTSAGGDRWQTKSGEESRWGQERCLWSRLKNEAVPGFRVLEGGGIGHFWAAGVARDRKRLRRRRLGVQSMVAKKAKRKP